MTDVLVIGGGAAGMMCAIEAAKSGADVLLLERMDRVGKKLLATGNGRCNLMNTGDIRYPRGGAFAGKVLSVCGAAEQKKIWKALGLSLREEEFGRTYPASSAATSVLDILRLSMDRYGVRVETSASIEHVYQSKNGMFTAVSEDGRKFTAVKVFIAGGGCAQPKLGSNGSAAAILRELGHKVHPFTPALTQVKTDTGNTKGLSGIRTKAVVGIVDGRHILHEEAGEVLFADYGLSGVCIMNSASYISTGTVIRLDLLAGFGIGNIEDFRQLLIERRKTWREQPMEMLLCGLCVPRLASALCKTAGIRFHDRLIGSLTDRECDQLCRVVSGWEFLPQGLKGFDTAQISRGGADPDEFDPATMESRLVPGLYAGGEVLDVDGECGGYNLMFAFGTGIIAGRNMGVTH